MKNKFSTINRLASITTIGLLLIAMLFSACVEEEPSGGPITISKVYLQDVNSAVPDREVTFGRLEQLLRIEGSGFTALKKVYINGFESYFNPVMATDNSMLVSIPENTPIVDAEADVRNTIKLANENYEAILNFEIRSAAPAITNISNTLPLAGETITVFGTGLTEVNKVVFPGELEVTDGIISDVDGEYFTVTVPSGIPDEGGSILIECSNGGAYSPAFFNFKKGVILDFDGIGVHGFWGSANSMIKDVDLESTSIGVGHVSHGVYAPLRPARMDTIKAATVRCSEVWTAGNGVDDWRGQLTPYIPTTTPVEDIAIQFDIYFNEVWEGSGYLKVCLVNGFNGGEWAGYSYNFVPWLFEGEVVPIETKAWRTVTIGLNNFYAFSDGAFTFEDVLLARENSDYKNFGFYFENSDFTLDKVTGKSSDSEIEFISKAITTLKVYTDNWRIVSLAMPEYSDFPAVGE